MLRNKKEYNDLSSPTGPKDSGLFRRGQGATTLPPHSFSCMQLARLLPGCKFVFPLADYSASGSCRKNGLYKALQHSCFPKYKCNKYGYLFGIEDEQLACKVLPY